MKINSIFKLAIFLLAQGVLCLGATGEPLSDKDACKNKVANAPPFMSLAWIGMTVTVDEEIKKKIEKESKRYAGVFEWRTEPKRFSKSIAFHPRRYENLEVTLLCYAKVDIETVSVLRIVKDRRIIYARNLPTNIYEEKNDKHVQKMLMDAVNEELLTLQGATLWTKGELIYEYERETRTFKKTSNLTPVKMGKMTVNHKGQKMLFLNSALDPIQLVLETGNYGTINFDLLSPYLNRKSGKLKLPALEILKKNFHLVDPRVSHPSWDKKTWDLITTQQVALGMTKDMAILSWGEPAKINVTTSNSTKHEQFVYPGSRYIYFVSGILTTIQD